MTEAKKRETAAEKRTRLLAEQTQREVAEWSDFTATYTVRFVNLMFRFKELDYANFRVKKVDEETFEFSREDYRYSDLMLKVTPPANYDWEYMNEFEQAASLLADYDAEQAENHRKETVRAAALAKLTKEERELLDL